jgi:hypothetical protein
VEVLLLVTQDFSVRDLHAISKVSKNLKNKISLFPIWRKIASTNTTEEVNPFPFVTKHIKAICDCCHKEVGMKGSTRSLKVYIQDTTKYNHFCLKCRKKHFQENPEMHRENDLMRGIISKTEAMKVYKLSAEDLEAVPHTSTYPSKYGRRIYTFKCAEIFSKTCLVHGRVVVLRHVSKVADNVYLN